MLLRGKNAVGYIGGAVAREFAQQDQMRMTRRSPRLDEVAAMAAFLASDKAGAITGTFVNATSGKFPS